MAPMPLPVGHASLGQARYPGGAPLPSEHLHPRVRRKAKRGYRFNWKKASLAAIAIYALVSFVSVGLKIGQANREVARLQAEHQALLQQSQELNRQRQQFNDPAYLEQLAREELGLIKPGEKIIVFTEPGNPLPLKKDKQAVYKD